MTTRGANAPPDAAGASLPSVQFRAGATTGGVLGTGGLQGQLAAAVQGGQAAFDFYSGESATRVELARAASQQGAAGWQQHPDAAALRLDFLIAGQPAMTLSASSGMLVLQAQLSPPVMQQDCGDYRSAGIATMYVVHGQTCMDVFITEIEKQGPGITGAALGPALLTVLGAFKTYLTSFFAKATALAESGATDAGAVAEEAASTAAEEAAVEGEVVAEEVAVSIEFGPLAIVGLVIAAVMLVWMIISFGLSKTMTAWIRLYNATHYPIQADLVYSYNLSPVQEPKAGAVLPVGVPPAPPGITPSGEQVIFRADWALQNAETLGGLGLCLRMINYAADFPSAMMMIDIPSVGANSMNATADGNVSASQYYAGNEGVNTSLSLVTPLGEDWTHDPVTLRVGTNQNSGESSSPMGGDSGYNYEYVIVLAQSSVLTVYAVPVFEGPATATFEAGQTGTFTIRTQAITGIPAATLSAANLPSWMGFRDNRDGTGSLLGWPPQNRPDRITIPVTARNDYASATENVTIVVQPAPAFTSPDQYVLLLGRAETLPITTIGFPAVPAITMAGNLPPGFTFADHHDGTAVIAGTAGSPADINVTLTATAGTITRIQQLQLACHTAPAFVAPSADLPVIVTVGEPVSITVQAIGFPTPRLTTDGFPARLLMADHGNGTATISGTVAAADSYTITIWAANDSDAAELSLQLNALSGSPITSADHVTFGRGKPGTFTLSSDPKAGPVDFTTCWTSGPPPPPPPGPQPVVERVDDNTARLAWTPPAAGQFGVGIQALSENGPQWYQLLKVTVVDASG
jgi:hypothetical protein